MKLQYCIVAALVCAISLLSCKPDNNGPLSEEPDIELVSPDQMLLLSEGGTYEILYRIINPQDDGKVSMTADEWIYNIDCIEEGKVTFSTDEYTADEARSTEAILTYSYGETGKKKVSINIIQDFNVPADIRCDADFFYGQFLAKCGNGGEDNFFLNISDGYDTYEGMGKPNAHFYGFSLFAPGTAGKDYENFVPEGTYVLGRPGVTATMTLSVDNSSFVQFDEDGCPAEELQFEEGSVTVSKNTDGTYRVRGRLTDSNGTTHDVRYDGECVCVNMEVPDEGYFPMEEDCNIHCISYEAYTNDGGLFMGNNMDIVFKFSNMKIEGDYYVVPGYLIAVEVNMPYDQDGRLTCGTYDTFVVKSGEWLNPFTVWPGDLQPFGVGCYGGSYAVLYDGYHWYPYAGLFNRGSLKIEEAAGGQYKCTGDFYTLEGKNVKFDYTGNIEVYGVPDPYVPVSTLEDDYVMKLDGKPAKAEYWGKDSWTMTIGDGENGDEMIIDLFTGGGFEGGITACEYIQGFGFCGAYVQGSAYEDWDGNIEELNTWLRMYDNGEKIGGAPVVGGTFDVKKSGEQYEFTFNVFDDKLNKITGTWKGKIECFNMENSAAAAMHRNRFDGKKAMTPESCPENPLRRHISK